MKCKQTEQKAEPINNTRFKLVSRLTTKKLFKLSSSSKLTSTAQGKLYINENKNFIRVDLAGSADNSCD